MKCLVCDHTIRIDTLKQLFATSSLLLCSRCEQNLIPKQGNILFESNEWLEQVIERLNQGDLILINLFKNRLKSELQKQKSSISNITIVEHADNLPYPWLEILVDEVLGASGSRRSTSTEGLVVSVIAHENIPNQISITA